MTARRVCSTLDMTREEWLKRRLEGIGGSDSPMIYLREKYPFGGDRVPELWALKRGLGVEPQKETPAMSRGTAMEPLIADMYAKQYEGKRKVQRVNAILAHSELDFMRADVDRIIVADDAHDGPGVLEIKCPGLRTFAKCKRDGLPDYYQIQLQHYLAVTGYTWGSFAVFNCENWEMLPPFDIDRDDDLIGQIIEEDVAFWKSVQNGERPELRLQESDEKSDLPVLQIDDAVADMSQNDGFIKAMADLAEAKEYKKLAEDIELDAKNRIINLMGVARADVAQCPVGRVYYRMQKGRETFDHKNYLKAFPDRFDEMQAFYKHGKSSPSFRPYFFKEAQ